MRNEKLIAARKKKKFSARYVAKMVKLNYRSYLNYEYTDMLPKVDAAFRIAEVLDEDPRNLFDADYKPLVHEKS